METSKSLKSVQITQSSTTTAQDRALRDELHTELKNKSKVCSNPTFDCSIPRLDGHDFCIRHILQDSRAAYKQCAYIYNPSGKRCSQPAPKHDAKKDANLTTYCFEHSRLAQLTKVRSSVGRYKTIESNEAYYNDLAHHIKIEKSNTPTNKISGDVDEEIDVVTPNADPFINFIHVGGYENYADLDGTKRRILDYASDSSSDCDVATINNTWKSYENDNSDNESIDSQDEDLLKHAGIYSAEETTMITKQKLVRLQSLYMDQFAHLQHLLKEKRRKYLQSIRKERETLCSIHDQPKETPQERRLYEKLKALNHFHRRHDTEAILHRKYQEKRLKAAGCNATKASTFSKCVFTEGGVKCAERTLPCSRFCRKHILEDKKQVLFRTCGIKKAGFVCKEPVPNIFEDATCVLHINLPTSKNYTQKKYESETEEEDDDVIKKEIKEELEDTQTGHVADEQIIEMFPVDDIGNNVTIAHDQHVPEEVIEKKPETNEQEVLYQVNPFPE